MIIDSHAHLKHGDEAGTEYSAAEIIRMMDAGGIDHAVVFAMKTTTARSVEMAEAAAREFPGRLIPYVYALPAYDEEVLPLIEEAIANRGFRGIKLHAGECTLGAHAADPVFDLAGRYGVPCLVDFAGDLSAASRIVEAFPATKLIVAHIGKYLSTDVALMDGFIDLAERNENVYLDVSGVVTLWKIEDAVRRVGSGRVLWGSDGPHPTPTVEDFVRLELAKVTRLDLSGDEKADILGGTVSRLLKPA